ncbi:MAG: hypothetical protein R6U11_03810 [Bacteroidales bacterium]
MTITGRIQNMIDLSNDETAILLAERVFKAMAYEQTVSAIVKPEQHRLVNELKIKDKHTGEIITDPDFIYKTSDQEYNLYLTSMRQFYIDNGFVLPTPDHSPLQMAEELTRKAKRLLIDYCTPFTGIAFNDLFTNFPSSYDNYVESTLELFDKSVKS